MRFGTFESPGLGAASFDDLTAKEADAVVGRAREQMPAALKRIVADLGEPDPERVERSLRAAGEWFLDRLPSSYGAEKPGSRWTRRLRRSQNDRPAIPPIPIVGGPWHPAWEEIDRDALPYWCWFKSGSGIFGPLGPAVVSDIDSLTAYVATLMLRSHPDAIVRRSSGTASSVDYRQPVVAIGDGREFSLPSRYDVMAIRALNPTHPHHRLGIDLDAFVRLLASWTRPLQPVTEQLAPPFTVVSTSRPGEFVVTFDDEIAHERSDSLDAASAELGRLPGVERVHREDREVLLAQAPTLSDDDVRAALERIWGTFNT